MCRFPVTGILAVLLPLLVGCANEPLAGSGRKAELPDTSRVSKERYQLSFQKAPVATHPHGDAARIKGGGNAYIGAIQLTVDGNAQEIPSRSHTDLGDPVEKSAKLGQYADGYVLKFRGGHKNDAYEAAFVFRNGVLSWRRVTWIGPDESGLRLMSHYKDTWYAAKKR